MKIVNRKVRRDYDVLEKLEVGVVLSGPEVKSVREGRISLNEAFVRIKDNEAFLINANIPPYKYADGRSYDSTRNRKLLLHRKEILRLQKKMEGRNLTLVPLSCYTMRRYIKIEIGLVRGRKKWEKKEKIRRRDLDREVERSLRNKRG